MVATLATVLSVFAVAACETANPGQEPDPILPPDAGPNPALLASSFRIDVSVNDRKVDISKPSSDGSGSFDILESQLDMLPGTNFEVTALNADENLIEFDVQVLNLLGTVDIIAPDRIPDISSAAATDGSATAPVGATLIPYAYQVVSTSGGATNGAGTDVFVTLPNQGICRASTDPAIGTGTPSVGSQVINGYFDFFPATVGDGTDGQTPLEFPFDEAASPGSDRIFGGSQSEASEVGFVCERFVNNFTVFLVVGGDLESNTGTPQGDVAGNVNSNLGPLDNVTVTLAPQGGSDATDAAGDYSITGQNFGPTTATLSGLPASCTDPGPQSGNIPNGGTLTLNFTVSCTVPSGTVQGQVSSPTAGPLQNVQVTVTPNGGSGQPVVTTDASGNYSRNNVPVADGTGQITIANLPGNCTDPGPTAYTGLTVGGTVTQDVSVTCTVPQGWAFTSTWNNATPGTGVQIQNFTTIDMSTFDAGGNDDNTLGAFDFNFTYDEAVILAPASNACIPTDPFSGFSVVPNSSTAGIVLISMFSTSGNATNPKPLTTCLFTTQAAGTSNQVFTFTSVANADAQVLDPANVLVVQNESVTVN
jgi:hypothetical protein